MYDITAVKAALCGPVPSISTPFKRDGSIDWVNLRRIIHFLLDNGAKTLLITFGDSLLTSLSSKEVGELVSFTVKETEKKAMVIGCGKQWWLGETLEFAHFCKEQEADLFIPVPPDWAQSADPGLLADFYREAGKIMPIMVLTALMSNRGVPLETFRILIESNAAGFVAVKDDTPSPYGRRLASLLGGRYGFLSGGRAENHLDVAPYGVDGYLSIFMRICPRIAKAYWKAYSAGDMDACVRWINTYEIPFMEMLNPLRINFDAAIHGMMELCGLCERWRRLPYSNATDEQMERLRDFLVQKNLLH